MVHRMTGNDEQLGTYRDLSKHGEHSGECRPEWRMLMFMRAQGVAWVLSLISPPEYPFFCLQASKCSVHFHPIAGLALTPLPSTFPIIIVLLLRTGSPNFPQIY